MTRILFTFVFAAALALGQTPKWSSAGSPIIIAAGAPASTLCDAQAEVGTVYINSDTVSGADKFYYCRNNGGVIGWGQGSGGGSGITVNGYWLATGDASGLTSLAITHNRNTLNVEGFCYASSGADLIPGSFIRTSVNVGTFGFGPAAPAGTTCVVFGASIGTSSSGVLVSALGTAVGHDNEIQLVTDGLTTSDTTVGGGTSKVLAISNGAAWVALGGGSGMGDPGGNGIVVRTALNTTTNRSLAAGAGLAVTNGDGIAGNPTPAYETLTTNAHLIVPPISENGTSNLTTAAVAAANTVYTLRVYVPRRITLNNIAIAEQQRKTEQRGCSFHIGSHFWPNRQHYNGNDAINTRA